MDLFKRAELQQKDMSGVPLHEGDVVLWASEDGRDHAACEVFWSGHKSAFQLRELNGTDPFCEYSFMRGGTYRILGSRYDDPGLVNTWQRLGVRGDLRALVGTFFTEMPDCCYPLAIVNACKAAGIKYPVLPNDADLLDRLIEVGECRKWGGAIDEQAVMAEAEKWLPVKLLHGDLSEVLAVGGVVTMKFPGGKYHAAACFVDGPDTYLVGSMLADGYFVRSDRPPFRHPPIRQPREPSRSHTPEILIHVLPLPAPEICDMRQGLGKPRVRRVPLPRLPLAGPALRLLPAGLAVEELQRDHGVPAVDGQDEEGVDQGEEAAEGCAFRL